MLSYLVAQEVDGFEGSLPMLAGKVVQSYAAVRQNFFYFEGPLLAVAAGHYLRPKRNVHLRTRPNFQRFCGGLLLPIK